MLRSIKIIILTAVVGLANLAVLPSDAQAGPLLDWLRGCRQRTGGLFQGRSGCNTFATPQTAIATPTSAQFAGTANPAGLQPGQCMRTCNQTCSRTVVNYVPYTAYRTSWKRVPNTQYRPVTNSDPCTGCTVTCMKPCTTYSWQMERQPYTTYRPVYRQENYSVPVTTITNDCATGTCGTCPTGTCGTGAIQQQPQVFSGQPTPALQSPASTAPQLDQFNRSFSAPQSFGSGTSGPISTGDSFQTQPFGSGTSSAIPATGGSSTRTSIPASSAPLLDSIPAGLNPQLNQRPILDRFPSTNSNGSNLDWNQVNNQRDGSYNVASNTSIDVGSIPVVRQRTAASPVRRQWSYSPVRLASHTEPVVETRAKREYRPETIPVRKASPKRSRQMNAGWEPVKW